MTSIRKRKAAICRLRLERSSRVAVHERFQDETRAVGREFGSAEFDRLMDEDHRNGVGVFHPSFKAELRPERP